MIGRKITFRIDDCDYSDIVYDKVRNGNNHHDMYLVKLEKDDMDMDFDTPDVMLVYPENIISIH
jgi:hypothetical protein